jgi:hypothetical protein
MIAPAGRLLRPIVLGAILALGQGGAAIAQAASPAPQSSTAGAALSATPAVLSTAIKPGGQGSSDLTLHAGQGLDITITAEGLGQSPDDGSFSYLPAAQDASPYTARPLISVSPSTFRMEAGSTQKISVSFTVPQSAGAGERYALLEVNGRPLPGSGNVGVGIALGVSVVVDLSGTSQTRSASIGGLTVARPVSGQPLAVSGTLSDTGNVHFGAPPNQIVETADVIAANGNTVATGTSTMTGNSLIPTFNRQFQLAVVPAQPLPAGQYRVQVKAALQDGTVLDQATTDFVVAASASSSALSGEGIPLIAAGLLGFGLAALVLFLIFGGRRLRRRAVRGGV